MKKAQIRGIADIQLDHLRSRLSERDMALTVDDSAFDLLIDAGFDPIYGARPLQNVQYSNKLKITWLRKFYLVNSSPEIIFWLKVIVIQLVFDKMKLS